MRPWTASRPPIQGLTYGSFFNLQGCPTQQYLLRCPGGSRLWPLPMCGGAWRACTRWSTIPAPDTPGSLWARYGSCNYVVCGPKSASPYQDALAKDFSGGGPYKSSGKPSGRGRTLTGASGVSEVGKPSCQGVVWDAGCVRAAAAALPGPLRCPSRRFGVGCRVRMGQRQGPPGAALNGPIRTPPCLYALGMLGATARPLTPLAPFVSSIAFKRAASCSITCICPA